MKKHIFDIPVAQSRDIITRYDRVSLGQGWIETKMAED